MSKYHPIPLMLLSCLVAPFLQGAGQLDEPTYDDNVYVNCPYRVAAIFPRPPMIRDITYRVAARSVPARPAWKSSAPSVRSNPATNFPVTSITGSSWA